MDGIVRYEDFDERDFQQLVANINTWLDQGNILPVSEHLDVEMVGGRPQIWVSIEFQYTSSDDAFVPKYRYFGVSGSPQDIKLMSNAWMNKHRIKSADNTKIKICRGLRFRLVRYIQTDQVLPWNHVDTVELTELAEREAAESD